MAKGNDAAAAIKREIKRLEQLQLAADILEEFGSLDNAIEESKKALTAIKSERAEAENDLATEREKVKALRVELKTIKEKSEKYCSDMQKDAEARAVDIIHTAQNECDIMIIDARQKAQAEINALKPSVESLEKRKTELTQHIFELDTKHKTLVSKIVDSEAKLSDIQKRARDLVGEQ